MNGVTTTIIDRNGSGNMRLPVQGGFTTNSVFATKFKFSYPYIFASWWCKLVIFKLRLLDRTELIVWRFTTFGCKYIKIRISEFVAKYDVYLINFIKFFTLSYCIFNHVRFYQVFLLYHSIYLIMLLSCFIIQCTKILLTLSCWVLNHTIFNALFLIVLNQ